MRRTRAHVCSSRRRVTASVIDSRNYLKSQLLEHHRPNQLQHGPSPGCREARAPRFVCPRKRRHHTQRTHFSFPLGLPRSDRLVRDAVAKLSAMQRHKQIEQVGCYESSSCLYH